MAREEMAWLGLHCHSGFLDESKDDVVHRDKSWFVVQKDEDMYLVLENLPASVYLVGPGRKRGKFFFREA